MKSSVLEVVEECDVKDFCAYVSYKEISFS